MIKISKYKSLGSSLKVSHFTTGAFDVCQSFRYRRISFQIFATEIRVLCYLGTIQPIFTGTVWCSHEHNWDTINIVLKLCLSTVSFFCGLASPSLVVQTTLCFIVHVLYDLPILIIGDLRTVPYRQEMSKLCHCGALWLACRYKTKE